MAKKENLQSTEPSTQEAFAKVANISQPRVSQLIRQGILTRGGTLDQWIAQLFEHQRKIIAGHESSSGVSLIDERARLSARQAERIEIETARMRGELLPLIVTKEIMEQQHGTVRARLLGLPNGMKQKYADFPTEQYLYLKELVNQCLTDLSHVRFPTELDERIKQSFRDLHSAAKPNGDAVGG